MGRVIKSVIEFTENYDTLRNQVNPETVSQVKVLGYSTPYDGGGGIFVRWTQTSPPRADDDKWWLRSNVSDRYVWGKWNT